MHLSCALFCGFVCAASSFAVANDQPLWGTALLACRGQFDGQGEHHTPKPYVRQAFRKYLECGIFAHGFARAWGDDCGLHPLAQASISKFSAEPVWFALKDAHLYEIATDILGLVHGTVAQAQQVLCGLCMIRVDRNANARRGMKR